jgi:hypothetical protein
MRRRYAGGTHAAGSSADHEQVEIMIGHHSGSSKTVAAM